MPTPVTNAMTHPLQNEGVIMGPHNSNKKTHKNLALLQRHSSSPQGTFQLIYLYRFIWNIQKYHPMPWVSLAFLMQGHSTLLHCNLCESASPPLHNSALQCPFFCKVFFPLILRFLNSFGFYFLSSFFLPFLLLQAILVKLLISSYLSVKQPPMTVLWCTNDGLHQP